MPHRRDDIPDDPYRWLEGDGEDVMVWVGEQNAQVDATINALPFLKDLTRDIERGVRLDSYSLPVLVKGGRRFSAFQHADANHETLMVRETDGSVRTLVDPNTLDPSGRTYVDDWEPSDNGRYLAFNLSRDGSEIGTLHVLDVDTGETLSERIPRTRYPGPTWLPDETGFYYTRLPSNETYDPRVYLHRLGTAWEDDPVIFGDGRPKTDTYETELSSDGRWLTINVDVDFQTNEVYLRDLMDPYGTFRVVFSGHQAHASGWVRDGRVYLWTDLEATNMRVLVADAGDPPADIAHWQTFIAEQDAPLEDIALAKDYTMLHHIRDAVSVLSIHDLRGNFLRTISLPTLATANVSAHEDSNELFVGLASFMLPFRTYECDPSSGELTLDTAPAFPFDPDDFIATQEWFASTDGVKVPCFVVRRRDLNLRTGPHPTLLVGYGGFSVSETPNFGGGRMAFLARGGVYVLANIRGGGEYGEAWHQAGMLARKQQSFDDFLSCARFLIAENITTPERLAIWGGSNGGLLVGAAITQAPELFAAAVCDVPLLDMLRFPLFPIGEYWISEYGDPSKEPDRSWLRAYSPYHAVKAKTRYPAVLFTTADTDMRVHPLHARKMAALLQDEGSGGPFLLRTHVNAGHGAGRPTDALVRDIAELYGFIWSRIGT